MNKNSRPLSLPPFASAYPKVTGRWPGTLSAVKKPGVTLFTDVPALLAGHETEVT